MTINNEKYDLEERTTIFSENLIAFCKKIKSTNINYPLINQLIRAGTSIGANYCEANGASSKKDFKNKIFICKKEAKETQYWLRLVSNDIADSLTTECNLLRQEAKELGMIFSAIANKTN